MSKTYTVPPAAPLNHGQTPAAWVMLIGVIAGAIATALGMAMSSTILLLAGIAVMVLTVIVSVIMRAVGLGQVRKR